MSLDDALGWLADRCCVVVLRAGSPRVRPPANLTLDGREWEAVKATLAAHRDEVVRRCGGREPAACRVCLACVYVDPADPGEPFRLCGRHGQSEYRRPADGVLVKAFVPACPWKPKHPEVPVPLGGWAEPEAI